MTTEARAEPMLEAREWIFIGGLALAGLGGALLSFPWTCIAIGSVIALKAIGPFVIVRHVEAE